MEELDPDLDAETLADVILAPLEAELFQHLRRERSLPLQRIKDGVRELIKSLG